MFGAPVELIVSASIEGMLHKAIHAWEHADPRQPVIPINWRDDPVYKKNLERLIEHHRQFEETTE